MSIKPKILITNDDGINAPGIYHLWNSLKDLAELTIVAPSQEQSAVGLGITLRSPLRISPMTWQNNTPAFSVTGTPADCVKLSLKVILENKPDLIVSGINRGSNAGRNVLYSGTVAGAIEGTLQGIPSIAFSCLDYPEPNYQKVESYIPKVVEYILSHPMPTGTLLNVNFPEKHFDIKGLKMARQGQELWAENPARREHPAEGHEYYWLGAQLMQFEEHSNSDIAWLKQGFIAAVPVFIGELTNLSFLDSKKDHFENFFSL